MSAALSAAPRRLSYPMRWLIFSLAAAVGVLGALGWSIDLSDLPYNFLLQAFLDPGFQVASLGVAVVLGFVLGFSHIFRI